LKYELGCLYMKVQKWQLAIPLLQQARSDPRMKGDALFKLGLCFYSDNKHQLALRQFESAMLDVKFDEKPDTFKDLHYAAGKLYELLKNPQAAEESYQKILEVDYNYRNTVARLNNLQGAGGTPPSS